MINSIHLLFLFFAGGIGSLIRYIISYLLKDYQQTFPFATLFVNLLGSLLIGCLSIILYERSLIRDVVLIGFLGGLTTFSTFSYESFHLIEQHKWFAFIGYVSSNIILGILLVFIGKSLASYL